MKFVVRVCFSRVIEAADLDDAMEMAELLNPPSTGFRVDQVRPYDPALEREPLV
jgi:hypothetical protein